MPHVHTDDFDCWYADDSFAEPWTAPTTVLIQVGFGRNGEYFRGWVPDLARDRRVLRRDMRAHGGSTSGHRPWSVERLADDVIAFLDALGLDRVHYVGESVGGITGIALGARAPERFHSITLVQTPIRLGPAVANLMKGDYPSWSAALRDLGPGGWVTRNMPPDSPRTRWEREQWDRCDVEALAALSDATATVDVAHYVPHVRVPTLILAPARSPLTPLADQWLLRTMIPDAQIEVFEGRDHDIYNDELGRCTRRVRQFFDEIESGRCGFDPSGPASG